MIVKTKEKYNMHILCPEYQSVQNPIYCIREGEREKQRNFTKMKKKS